MGARVNSDCRALTEDFFSSLPPRHMTWEPSIARVQRGHSEAARCTSTEDHQGLHPLLCSGSKGSSRVSSHPFHRARSASRRMVWRLPSHPSEAAALREHAWHQCTLPSARPQQAKRRRRTLQYVESLSDARTPLGKRRVSARRGLAGEKRDFFTILLGDRSKLTPPP